MKFEGTQDLDCFDPGGVIVQAFGTAMTALAVLFSSCVVANAATVARVNTITGGATVDLSGIASGTVISPTDAIFSNAGISSLTTDNRASTNNEFYDSGQFGAGRAIFNTEDGDLLVLDEGASVDYGSPTFIITLQNDVTEFGFRLADTSSSFATPEVTFFNGNTQVASVLITESYNANTFFGFSLDMIFNQVIINTDTVGSGFGFDGVGITDLTVGAASDLAPVPLPGAALFMATGLVGFFARRSRRNT